MEAYVWVALIANTFPIGASTNIKVKMDYIAWATKMYLCYDSHEIIIWNGKMGS